MVVVRPRFTASSNEFPFSRPSHAVVHYNDIIINSKSTFNVCLEDTYVHVYVSLHVHT